MVEPPDSPSSRPGWIPPDDGWDRPVLRLRSAWVSGAGLVVAGAGAVVVTLTGMLGIVELAGAVRLAVGVLGVVAMLVGLTLLAAAAQAWIRIRRQS